jgi:hypothetical protein
MSLKEGQATGCVQQWIDPLPRRHIQRSMARAQIV